MMGHNGALALAAFSLERRRRIGESRRQYKNADAAAGLAFGSSRQVAGL
jgi:hypothetical protein